MHENRLPDAESALKQALSLQTTSETRPEVAAAVKQWKSDLAVALRLAEIEQGGVNGADGSVPGSAQAAAYQKVLDDYGINLSLARLDESAERIRSSPIQLQLLTAIHDGALSLTLPDSLAFAGDYPRLRQQWLQLAATADKDPWRATLREAVEREDESKLLQLAADDAWQRQPPVLVALLGEELAWSEGEAGEALLEVAAQRYPNNFRIIRAIGIAFSHYWPGGRDVEYFRMCVERRPENADVCALLGWALIRVDKDAEGEAELREAIRLQPACSYAYSKLGCALHESKRLPDAEAAFRRAMEFDPTDYYPGGQVLEILRQRGNAATATTTFEQAVKRYPDSAPAHFHLGNALLDQKRVADAERAFREARRLDPNSIEPLRTRQCTRDPGETD